MGTVHGRAWCSLDRCCEDADASPRRSPLLRRPIVGQSERGTDRWQDGSSWNAIAQRGSEAARRIPVPNNEREKDVQIMRQPLRPPSVEDEKQFMRSSLQRILAEQAQAPRECLLCMEEFNDEHPSILTLCKCGVNKHHFHMRCLEEWRRRSGKTTCPVCNQDLFVQNS
mmetsp:Transcript_2422/g.4671  ORF Transcript_2422/g.4671 Transcript_2422/m.4671 type:complete len:169 (-) Transcript_2422:1180-1686(-)